MAFGITRRERTEVRSAKRQRRIVIVDCRNFRDGKPAAVIVSGTGDDFVAATETVRTNQVRPNIRIAHIGQIAVHMAPNKSTVARWIEPPFGCRIGNYDRRRSGLLLFDGLSTLATLPAATSALAASPVATATAAAALVPLIAVELLAAGMLPLTVLLTRLPLLRRR